MLVIGHSTGGESLIFWCSNGGTGCKITRFGHIIFSMDIVLVEPQIPQNTGSIARTCAATRCTLHIVGPTPFEISDRTVKRAGLDYWPWVHLKIHESWEAFIESRKPERLWYLSKFGERAYYDVKFGPDDCLVFGSETKGLGKPFLSKQPADSILLIPMDQPEVRSLNLSNSVSIVLFEARRQLAVNGG